MLDDVTFRTETLQLQKNDLIFLYTDGLFCAGANCDFNGWDKVTKASAQLKKALTENPEEFLEEIYYAFHMIHKSSNKDFNDDVAMMLIRLL